MSASNTHASKLPLILAGPILRRASADRLVLWLVTSQAVQVGVALYPQDDGTAAGAPAWVIKPLADPPMLPIGTHAFVHCLDIALGEGTPYPLLPEEQPIGYEMQLFDAQAQPLPHNGLDGLTYPGEQRPRFVIRQRVTHLLHGSCRRPHHPAADGMVRADTWLAERRTQVEAWPTALVLAGDQVYCDDVAGPMITAIHSLIARLGLHGEIIQGAEVADDQALFTDARNYYQRDTLLPSTQQNMTLQERFFGGTRKPIFTSVSSKNHLITLSEVMAMYLLAWSDVCWQLVTQQAPQLSAEYQALYAQEAKAIEAFAQGIGHTRRLLAHIPTVMIFDDHDITDDWNMTADWESIAYGHPFSRRIIGNALIGYFVCQGWGNAPELFDSAVLPKARAYFNQPDCARQNQLIDTLLKFEHWHYSLPTEPPLMVLDTRTQRWRSERVTTRPSGLMDWEALTEMQQGLMHNSAVILVSPTPIFGVKLIETIQRLFTWLGKPLVVDAENWMGHRGSAYTLLNIFRHAKTPSHFTVLSGDVHYSFVYDVKLRRGKRNRPSIWQITSSGIKNEFPRQLLDWFDRLNRWLFAPYSPLNWFTKRRRMRVTPRNPKPSAVGERLVNRAGIGYVRFDAAGKPVEIRQLGADGVDVTFTPGHMEEV